MDEYRLLGKIIEVKGHCSAGQYIYALFTVVEVSPGRGKNVKIAVCPDRINTVTMKMERKKV